MKKIAENACHSSKPNFLHGLLGVIKYPVLIISTYYDDIPEKGLNFKRKGLITLLDRCYNGVVGTVVVAHRDRLARFGFDIFKHAIESNGGKLMVLDKISCSPEEELTQDLLSILHVFSCRMHGLRSYRKKIKKDTALSDKRAK
ncbi:putative resolvase [Candidatus Magnetomoraceae bacterium gMMP-15]